LVLDLELYLVSLGGSSLKKWFCENHFLRELPPKETYLPSLRSKRGIIIVQKKEEDSSKESPSPVVPLVVKTNGLCI